MFNDLDQFRTVENSILKSIYWKQMQYSPSWFLQDFHIKRIYTQIKNFFYNPITIFFRFDWRHGHAVTGGGTVAGVVFHDDDVESRAARTSKRYNFIIRQFRFALQTYILLRRNIYTHTKIEHKSMTTLFLFFPNFQSHFSCVRARSKQFFVYPSYMFFFSIWVWCERM